VSPLVSRTDASGVVELCLERPAQRNAFTSELLRELRAHVRDIGDDPSVRAVLLRGTGPVFCAGADLREFADRDAHSPNDTLARVRLLVDVLRGLLELEAPTLALVQGAAVGGGWGLAMACDLCWATEDASFSLPEVAKGFRLPRVIVTRLAHIVGPVRAAQLVLGGDVLTAADAAAMGLVAARRPSGEALQADGRAFAQRLAELPRATVQAAKDPLRNLHQRSASPESDYIWNEE
jgi:enoyl-CoA hydratase/carnithine racemase